MRGWVKVLTVVFIAGVVGSAERLSGAEADVVRVGKRATALVEIGEAGSGTAFCIDPQGLFVTNHHVVAALPAGQKLKVVINPAEEGQRVLDADVVAISEKADLALIWAREARNVPALVLGDDKNLFETQAITAFGYPFGKMLAVDSAHYPSVSVNTGKVTSLRREEGKLAYIQLDATINPGNSGGPVLDAGGKVVGVISSGMQTLFGAAGVNFAVPVSQLRELMGVPHLWISAPAMRYEDRFTPVDLVCRLVGGSADRQGAKLTLELSSAGAVARTVDMTRMSDGAYHAKIAPAVKSTGNTPVVAVTVLGEKGVVAGWIQDHAIKVGAQSVDMSKVKSIDRYPTAVVKTSDGRTLNGEVTGLGQIQTLPNRGKLDLASVFRVQVDQNAQGDAGIQYQVVARQGEKIIADVSGGLAFEGANENGAASRALPADSASSSSALAADTETLKFPPGISIATVGGGGRLLVIYDKSARLFAVIDIGAGKVVRYIPVDADMVMSASGADDLVVYVRDTRELQRYDLRTGKLLLTRRIEFPGNIELMEMGAGSTGPALAAFTDGAKRLYDVATLRHIPEQFGRTTYGFGQYRASADGSTFTGWFGGGEYRLHTWGNHLTGRFIDHDFGDPYPNFDGSALYGYYAVLGPDQKPIVPESHNHRYLATWSGGLYVRLGAGGLSSRIDAELCNATDQKVLCPLPKMPELLVTPQTEPSPIWIDRRMAFFPNDNAIVTIPLTDDRVVLRRFDFGKAIAKASPAAAMYLKSVPPTRFSQGAPYKYAVQLGGGKPPYRYQLDVAPAGMGISTDGQVTWKPSAVSSDELPVAISVTDSGGGKLLHRFSLQPARNPAGRCPRLRVDGTTIAEGVRAEFDRLVAALAKNPADSASSAKFAELCLAEIDAPEFTRIYQARLSADLEKIVDLAMRPVGDLSEKEAGDLAQWYFDQASGRTGASKEICLRNAGLYWGEWTLLHPQMDAERKDVEKKLKPVSESSGIDLLAMLKNEIYALDGKWKLTEAGLEAAGGETGTEHPRVQFPCLPIGSYRLHVEFTAKAGPEVDVAFPTGAGNATLVLGAWNGHAAIMDTVGHRPNHSPFGDFVMQPNHRYLVDISVALQDDDVAVSVYLDGAPLTSWKSKQTGLNENRAWQMPVKGAIGVGAAKMAATFHVVKLFPISRERALKPYAGLEPVTMGGAMTYLSELNLNAKADANHGIAANGSPMTVALGKRYSRLEGAARADSGAATFKIRCDGRDVWNSAARKGADENFSVDVSNAAVVEMSGTGGAWVMPRLIGADETPVVSPGAPVWKAALAAAKGGPVQASPLIGGAGGKTFRDFPADGGVLVGLRITMNAEQRDWRIQSLQGIYLTAAGRRVLGERRGSPGETSADYEAPPGFAIGALNVAGQNEVDGFNITCVRLAENGLDAKETQAHVMWYGRSKPRGGKHEIGVEGKAIVGLTGRAGDGLEALGVLTAP